MSKTPSIKWKVDLVRWLDEQEYTSVSVRAKVPTEYIDAIMRICNNDGKLFDETIIKALFRGIIETIYENVRSNENGK